MAFYFQGFLALDPSSNGQTVAANADVVVHDPNDATKAPLPLVDASGMALPNPMTTSSMGATGPFFAPLAEVAWSSGQFKNTVHSFTGLTDLSNEALDQARSAAAEALAARQAAEALAEAGDLGTIRDQLTAMEGAVSQVDDAVAQANAAAQAVATATADAAAAKTAADAAKATADAAAGGITTAQTTATTAKTTADTAKATADAAKTAADNALAAGGGVLVGKSSGEGATPVQSGKLLLDITKGRLFAGLDLGPSPRVNLAKTPHFSRQPLNAAGKLVTVNRPTPLPAVKVGSYNLYGAGVGGAEEKTPWSGRKANSAAQITASGASLVGIQEISNVVADQLGDLVAILGTKWKSVQGAFTRVLRNGVLYDSTVWAVDGELVTVELPGPDARSFVYVRMRHIASGVRIYFGSAHLSMTPAELAIDQLKVVGATVKALRERTGLEVLMAGDWAFNETDAVKGGVLPSYGLTAMKVKGTPTLTRADWSTFSEWDATYVNTKHSSWIDQVYVTDGVTVDAAEVVATFADGAALPLTTPMPSDHQMVAATVRVLTAQAVALHGSETTGITSGAASVTYRDPTWSQLGGPGAASLCIDPAPSTGTATAAYPVGQSDSMTRVGWVIGKTYCVSATIHLEQAQSGTLDSQARRFTIGTAIGGAAANFNAFASAAAPNAAGTTRLFVVFTVPTGATQCFIRLMNGSRAEKVWWDALLIEEVPAGTTAPPPYFDGDVAGCRWEMTPGYSFSKYPGPSWVEVGA